MLFLCSIILNILGHFERDYQHGRGSNGNNQKGWNVKCKRESDRIYFNENILKIMHSKKKQLLQQCIVS